ncbi:hypothetical protein LXL04_007516 [Taraxacum kok-saghyz]
MSATHRSGKHTISEVGESSSAARPVVRRRRGFLPVDEVWITEIQPLTIITFKSFLEQQILILFVAPNSNFISLSSQLKGVDRKSILCDFSKADQCAKGFEFKFSHDLNVQRRVTRLIHSGGMGSRDVGKGHQLKTKRVQPKLTDIVCRHFLDVVEKKQYGWFWVFPNEGSLRESKSEHNNLLDYWYVYGLEEGKVDEITSRMAVQRAARAKNDHMRWKEL